MRSFALFITLLIDAAYYRFREFMNFMFSLHADTGRDRPAPVVGDVVAQVGFVPSIYPKRPCSATHGFA